MSARIVVAGSGSCVPEFEITNEQIREFLGVPRRAGVIEKLTGMRFRRMMAPFDENGRPLSPCDELYMAENAGEHALRDIDRTQVDGLVYISCTPVGDRERLSKSAYELHRRLRLGPGCMVHFGDYGCGGFLHWLISASSLLRGSDLRNFLVVASNGMSTQFADNRPTYLEKKAWLSAYIFGDGAGAMLLQKRDAPESAGIVGSYLGVDTTMPLFEVVRDAEHVVYVMDAHAVEHVYKKYMVSAVRTLQERLHFRLSDIKRFYLHQPNAVLLDWLIETLALPPERVARHVEKYGNTSAAVTPILFSEDVRAGAVQPGDLCLFATIGAGTQYSAVLLRT